jgi:type I restriction enzyme S subunit
MMMTKLEQLINELCPEGVEYCELGKVCSLVTGATPSKVKSDYWENGTIPWMSSGEVNNKIIYDTEQKITQLGYNSTSTTIVPVHSIVIALAGQGKTRGKVAITEIELCTNQSLCSMICGERIFYKFLYYYLDSKYLELREISNGDGARGGLSLKILSPYKVPVPPIEVQYEVVRILDNFTEVTVELTEKLTAELTARKQQYEYYRDKLLTYDAHHGEQEFAEVFDVITDFTAAGSFADIAKNVVYQNAPDYAQLVRTTDLKHSFNNSDFVYISKEAYDYLWRVQLTQESIVLPNIGVNCGEVYYVTPTKLPYQNNALGPNAILVRSTENNNRFLFYLLHSNSFQAQLRRIISAGGQPKFNKTELKKLKLCLPSRKVQDKIVDVLDNFDALCSDLNIGLPAEIEARQKQYEYYRDKLLSFKNVEG